MTDNLYAPPQADMSKTPVSAGSDDSFYVVSQRKFTLLFVLTFSMYLYYWFYKNWANYKKECQSRNSTDSDVWPVARAIFAIFFIHSLFRRVDQHAEAKMRPLNWSASNSATLLVVLFIVTGVINSVLPPLAGPFVGTLAMVGLLAALCFRMRDAQGHINASCGDAEGAANTQLTTANYVWMGLGIVFWIFTILGMFAPRPV